MEPFLPHAIIGNSGLLATLDTTGRVRQLFWPHIDFPQHLRFFRLGVGWQHPSLGKGTPRVLRHHTRARSVSWLHNPPWRHWSRYLADSNVLVVWHYAATLIGEVVFVPPGRNFLVCHLTFYHRCGGPAAAWLALGPRPGSLLQPGTTGYLPDQDTLVAYNRDHFLGLTAQPPATAYHCGRQGSAFDPLRAGAAGHLGLQPVANSLAGACLAWTPVPQEITLYLVMASSAGELAREIAAARRAGYRQLLEEATGDTRQYLAGSRRFPVSLPSLPATVQSTNRPALAGRPGPGKHTCLQELYRRSLLVLRLLQDQSGALIAAPEVDPGYRRSGGYGYCWGRDAVYMAWALAQAGYTEQAARYYTFACRVQNPDGLWQQRHYASGHLAPGWGRQMDETGTILWGLAQHYRLTREQGFLTAKWPAVRRAAEGLLRTLRPPAPEPPPTLDLWEERCGQHAYTWASLAAGLREAAWLAREVGEESLAARWRQAGADLARSTLARFWDPSRGRFFRTLREPGRPVDLSLLGMVYPFGLLPAGDPRARDTAMAIMHELSTGDGFARYPRDRYSRGRPWPLAGLWLAIYWHLTAEDGKAWQLFTRASGQANALGLFPEQVHSQSGRPAWVVPLGWTHALFILATLMLYGKERRPNPEGV